MTLHLPNAEQAIVDVAKLREYCLNPLHPEGRHKARVFLSALGVSQNDAEWLRSEILTGIQAASIIRSDDTKFGSRYTADICLINHSFRATVRTGWIIRSGEGIPRLTTCFVV
jgi:hypothetical protein